MGMARCSVALAVVLGNLPMVLGDFVLTGGSAFTQAIDAAHSGLPFALDPLPGLTRVVQHYQSSAATSFNSSGAGFRFDVDHERAGTPGSLGRSQGFVQFEVVGGIHSYELYGQYSLAGAAGLLLEATLVDLTSPGALFQNTQHSRMSASQGFTLGGTDGDFANSLAGSLTGHLIPGHTYRLLFDTQTFLTPAQAPDGGALAEGGFGMSVTPIPAPGALVLGLLGLACTDLRRR